MSIADDLNARLPGLHRSDPWSSAATSQSWWPSLYSPCFQLGSSSALSSGRVYENPSAPIVTAISDESVRATTGCGLPSRSSTSEASVYQDGTTGLPHQSRRWLSCTSHVITGLSGSPV